MEVQCLRNLKGDTMEELLMLLGQGNPGALNILMRLDLEHLTLLADKGIYGSDIWVLYKDKCGEDLDKFKAKLSE